MRAESQSGPAGKGKRVSLFVHNLSQNPIVRAAPFAWALQSLGYEVEILGFLEQGSQVYLPYRDAFEYRTVSFRKILLAPLRAGALASLARGDWFYAFKPLPTTLLPAVLAARGSRKKVLLDVEDDDLGVCGLNRMQRFTRTALGSFTQPQGVLLEGVHALRHRTVHTTVSTQRLRSFYGGTVVLHGPDHRAFDPLQAHLDRNATRRRFGLPVDMPLVLFAGKAQRHKGLETIVGALQKEKASNYGLVLAGDAQQKRFQKAKAALGERCFLLGNCDHSQMPELLHCVDVVPTIQLRSEFAEAQLPAKLLEAMAMAKTVLVSRVGDLPALVGENTANPRGWVVEPGDADELAESLYQIHANPLERANRQDAARAFFIENASTQAIASRLESLLP